MSTITKLQDQWQAKLARSADLLIPTDYPRTTNDTTSTQLSTPYDLVQFDLTNDIIQHNINQLIQCSNTGYNHVLLTTITILLYRWCNDQSFNISLINNAQPLLLCTDVQLDHTFVKLAQQLHDSVNEATKHQLSYNELDLLRTDAIGPLYRIVVQYSSTYQHNNSSTNMLCSDDDSVKHDSATQTNGVSRYPQYVDMIFTITPQSIYIQYNTALFNSSRIQCYSEQLQYLLQLMSTEQNHNQSITQLSLIQPGGIQQKILPDPTTDLHWNDWYGAIHDIFSMNARKYSTRTCIVESRRNSNIPREFTYQHILHASNTLAHYLIRSGLQQESVVTVYASRSAELVIAFMAVLKAGGVISVIDPAYPTHRQIVYLQVAQPSSLIVMSLAGTLADDVRQYINDELNLCCMIPALNIDDNGILYTSHDHNNDALNTLRTQQSIDPDIVIGPDSWGTLSFTSGTTGLPKGVQGRHFSLTHYYHWMSQQFSLTANDRFTMLSGIAHDPIQRDIFTPLYLSATLYIPDQIDIITPGKLAQWFNSNHITVTHLTPAMGQLLSSHATIQINTLQRAFFVGDILTKRDTVKLCKLAPNLQLINMYGTTETQRAVSYYTVPSYNSHTESHGTSYLSSEKDIIPAGQGMNNVQLLVVNRRDKTKLCGVGEVGEIYVRAGGLAEGYLKLPDATSDKFWLNWFTDLPVDSKLPLNQTILQTTYNQQVNKYWLGKRDRLYRTGDLGRYRSDGLVECSGRADDQVKIRGFRVELGEIDTYLSQYHAIRENVTVVRRDKSNELIIVSFLVLNNLHEHSDDDDDMNSDAVQQPGIVNWYSTHRCTGICRGITQYLSSKLPTYAIPTQYVILRFMPLTPNGKADKSILQIPDSLYYISTRKQYKHIQSKSTKNKQQRDVDPRLDELNILLSLSPTQQKLYMLYVKLLPSVSQPCPINQSFFDLGGHSVLATQLLYEINTLFQIQLSPMILFSDIEPSIINLAKHIDIELQSNNNNHKLVHTVQTIANSTAEQVNQHTNGYTASTPVYSDDIHILSQQLAPHYTPSPGTNKPHTVLLTGVTGFLGNFTLQSIMNSDETTHVVCIVRGTSNQQAYERMKSIAQKHCIWSDQYVSRVTVLAGDIAQPKFGLTDNEFIELGTRIDSIIHNGAIVHWLYSYNKLRSTNVLSTMTCIELATLDTDATKSIVFISSTAVLGNKHYNTLDYVSESDELQQSHTSLTDGYGQSKYVSEQLIILARTRGLSAAIVRPAYILGNSTSGVTNTDDFIWRLVKWCVQYNIWPSECNKLLNAMSVDDVSNIILRVNNAVLNNQSHSVYHSVNNTTQLQWTSIHNVLQQCGYTIKSVSYQQWCRQLQQYISDLSVDDIPHSTIYPIHHILLHNLPEFCESAALDNTNMLSLYNNNTDQLHNPITVLQYNIAFLVHINYLQPPSPQSSSRLPKLPVELLQHAAVLTRTTA